MANYGRGWDDGYGGQSAEAQDAYAERDRIEGERLQRQEPDNHMLPCPFCGSHAVFEPRMDGAIIRCSKRLDGCPVNMRTSKHETFKEAQKAWNTRA